MNFILNHKYSDGNTPIRPEEAEQLIPSTWALCRNDPRTLV